MVAVEPKDIFLAIGDGDQILCNRGAKARLSPVSTTDARPP